MRRHYRNHSSSPSASMPITGSVMLGPAPSSSSTLSLAPTHVAPATSRKTDSTAGSRSSSNVKYQPYPRPYRVDHQGSGLSPPSEVYQSSSSSGSASPETADVHPDREIEASLAFYGVNGVTSAVPRGGAGGRYSYEDTSQMGQSFSRHEV